MVSLPSLPRQMPEKLTTAPMSVRPCVTAAISFAMSKSACWMRMVTLAVMRSSRWLFHILFEHDLFGKPVPTFPDHALTAGHRRGERNLRGGGHYGICFVVGMVEPRTDQPRRLGGMGVSLAAPRQPRHQVV